MKTPKALAVTDSLIAWIEQAREAIARANAAHENLQQAMDELKEAVDEGDRLWRLVSNNDGILDLRRIASQR